MHPPSQPIITPGQFLLLLARYPARWLLPAVVVASLAGVYAAVRPTTWEASQALMVRDQAAGSHDNLGRFNHSQEMKTVQETILELAHSRKVLAGALSDVGPPPGEKLAQDTWPASRDVGELRGLFEVVPPKGAEFGMTEIFYLKVRNHDRRRAAALVAAIADQLEHRFQELRSTKVQSVVRELEKAVDLGQLDLDKSTARLAEIENSVGSDLGELRSLDAWGAGETALRRTISEIDSELREARSAKNSTQELLDLLEAAQADPGRLVAMPSRLLESHPALSRLKDGLVDAQLQTAELMGSMSKNHPLVVAAKHSEAEISQHLQNELPAAVRGLNLDLALHAHRASTLENRVNEVTDRLNRIAKLRAEYSNQVAENGNRIGLLKQAEERLAEARVSLAGASAANLISQIDTPDDGDTPASLPAGAIVLVGLVGGGLIGLGILLLTVEPLAQPPPPTQSQMQLQTLRTIYVETPAVAYPGDVNTRTSVELAGVLSFKRALERIAHVEADKP